MSENKHVWFGPKAYGYGFTPTTWQGWALTGVLLLVVLAAVRILPAVIGPLGVIVAIIANVGVYFWLVSRHSEGDLGWRWRGRRQD